MTRYRDVDNVIPDDDDLEYCWEDEPTYSSVEYAKKKRLMEEEKDGGKNGKS